MNLFSICLKLFWDIFKSCMYGLFLICKISSLIESYFNSQLLMLKCSKAESESLPNAFEIILTPANVNVLDEISSDFSLDYINILQILFADLSVMEQELMTSLEMNDFWKCRDKHDTPVSPILTLERLRIFKHLPCVINKSKFLTSLRLNTFFCLVTEFLSDKDITWFVSIKVSIRRSKQADVILLLLRISSHILSFLINRFIMQSILVIPTLLHVKSKLYKLVFFSSILHNTLTDMSLNPKSCRTNFPFV